MALTSTEHSVLKTTFFLISALGVPVAYTGLCDRRVCMYLNSALHRPTREAVMTPDLIDHTLCTHINYGFADVSKNTLVPVELTDMSKSNFIGNYEKLRMLKARNPDIKLLISMSSLYVNFGEWYKMISSQKTRQTFASSAVRFLRQILFDGLDIHFPYPTLLVTRNYSLAFTELLKQLRQAFNAEASGSERLLLTAGLSAIALLYGGGNFYDVGTITAQVDWINLYLHDIRTWSPRGVTIQRRGITVIPSPISSDSNDEDADKNNTFLELISRWRRIVPAGKLVGSLALYGRSFTLLTQSTAVGAPAIPGRQGPYTKERGFLAYYEICKYIDDGASIVYVPRSSALYLVMGIDWVGYDDKGTFFEKLSHLRRLGFGGYIIFTLDYDDFRGEFCSRGKFPFTSYLKKQC